MGSTCGSAGASKPWKATEPARCAGPPHRPGFVAGLEQTTYRTTHSLLDGLADRTRMDVVDDLTYPLPVSIICRVLGVPIEDEPQFSQWTAQIAKLASPIEDVSEQDLQEIRGAVQESLAYLLELVERRKTDPGDDMISGMVNDDPRGGRLPDYEIASNAIILLIGGHETTVNAMASGILLLLRHPEKMELLRERPELMAGAFEEILRLEPPLQFRPRTTLADIELGGTTIPRGSTAIICYAAANRDPKRFRDPEVFDPQREDNQHTSFNLGIHYCFGAPLARLEGRVFLNSWLRRVRNPRLVEDPPPYRRSAALRGPLHLLVDYDGILPADA
jgi:cytochrome P450